MSTKMGESQAFEAEETGIADENAKLVWASAITALAVLLVLVAWYVGPLALLRGALWLVFAFTVSGAAIFLLGQHAAGDDQDAMRNLGLGSGGIAIAAALGLFFTPKPAVPIRTSNLQLASVTLIGECIEQNLFSTDRHRWHGSAFVYGRDGDSLVLYTNAHCLGVQELAKDGAAEFDGMAEIASFQLFVAFPSGEVRRAERIAVCSVRKDVACVQVSAAGLKEGRDYLVVPTAHSRINRLGVKPGDDVIALGSPIDPELKGTQTFGKISAVRSDESSLWLQHDAAINSGNSGGPLFLNRRGKLYWIGINTIKVTDGESLGFSISADDVTGCDYEWRAADTSGLADLINLFGGHARAVR